MRSTSAREWGGVGRQQEDTQSLPPPRQGEGDGRGAGRLPHAALAAEEEEAEAGRGHLVQPRQAEARRPPHPRPSSPRPSSPAPSHSPTPGEEGDLRGGSNRVPLSRCGGWRGAGGGFRGEGHRGGGTPKPGWPSASRRQTPPRLRRPLRQEPDLPPRERLPDLPEGLRLRPAALAAERAIVPGRQHAVDDQVPHRDAGGFEGGEGVPGFRRGRGPRGAAPR